MADYTIKQNDTAPVIRATLSDQDGPIDLTEASAVHIYLKPPTGKIVKTSPCNFGEKSQGEVEYQWEKAEGEDPADLGTAGSYEGEFEITWKDGRTTTVPSAGYFSLAVIADLGPEP